MENIVLIGFQGVGKTFFGNKIAKLLKMNFIDTDKELEGFFNNRYSVRNIYKHLGKESFRAKEKKVLESLFYVNNTVIATGGGVVEIKNAASILKRLGKVVYLYKELEVLRSRWKQEGRFLKGLNQKDVYRQRDNLYNRCCREKVEGNWDQILLANSLQ